MNILLSAFACKMIPSKLLDSVIIPIKRLLFAVLNDIPSSEFNLEMKFLIVLLSEKATIKPGLVPFLIVTFEA